MENQIRILIGDDHFVVRTGIISLLKSQDNLFVIGEAENGEQLIERYFNLKPDVVIADIAMPVLSGTDAIARIKEKDPDVKALFLSMHEGDEYIYHIYRCGGLGLVNKNIVQGEMVFAINKVLKGEYYFGPGIDDMKLEEIIHRYENKTNVKENSSIKELTERENEVLLLIGDAKTSVEIADILNLSKRTVDTHRANIMQKLGIKSLPELIRLALKHKQG